MTIRVYRREERRARSVSPRAATARPRVAASLVLAAVLASGVAAQAGGSFFTLPGAGGPLAVAISSEAPELASFYAARHYHPLWVRDGKPRPEAQALIALIASAPQDGLDPERYGLSELKTSYADAQNGDRAALARFEVDASRAFAGYVLDLHRPPADGAMIYTDPVAAPPALTAPAILQAAADAPSLQGYLGQARKMNPIYEGLRRDLALYRAKEGGRPPDATERLILVNLDRARALPADPGPRYIVVDVPSATLWMYENGHAVDSMKVVAGKQNEPTPIMAGAIRYALFNPYWNIPQDLIRDGWAPRVLHEGPQVLEEHHLEALSDWTPNARVLDPKSVDWAAVAAGRQYLRMRQKPGPDNMMGRVKFMLPNRLGIYLHDTPNKALFDQSGRWFSSGCVRLQDAPRLARWLFGQTPSTAAPEYRVDLARPVPVYITYFTAAPSPSGAVIRQDVYGRDATSLAALSQRLDDASA